MFSIPFRFEAIRIAPNLPIIFMQGQRFLLSLSIVTLCISCGHNPLEVDVSNIQVDFAAKRFDTELYSIQLESTDSTLQKLYQFSNGFYEPYVEAILQLGPAAEERTISYLSQFLYYEDTRSTQEAIHQVHDPKIEEYNSQLLEAFKHHRYHFPGDTIPLVVYMNSGFNTSIFPFDDRYLGIGLDYYLGTDNPITQKLDPQIFPVYMREKMRPEYVVSSAVRGWLLVKYADEYYRSENLLSEILYWGKVMYVVDALLQGTPDYLKIDYQSIDIEWCIKNERSIWIELQHQEVLFGQKRAEIDKWVAEGPFTNVGGIPQNSPSRLGVWMGWQIVRDYMDRNPEVTLKQLLAEKNHTKILNAYRPG